MNRHFIIIQFLVLTLATGHIQANIASRPIAAEAASPTTVDDPVSFSAEAIDLGRIDLLWQKNALGQDVLLAYSLSGIFGIPVNGTAYSPGDPISGGGTVLYSGDATSFSHTLLNDSTAYFYKIWSFDELSDYSAGITDQTFTGFPLTYLQGFPSTTLPPAWISDMAGVAAHGTSGTIGLTTRLNSSGSSGYAISPLVGNITSNTNLSFHYRIVDYIGYPLNGTVPAAGNQVEIQVSTDDGESFTTIHTIDYVNHISSADFANKVINLGAFAGDYIRVRFLCTRVSGDFFIDLDNILIENGTNMSFSTATAEQPNQSIVGIGTTNNDIIRLQIVTQKGDNPLFFNSINVQVSGDAQVSSCRIFYTTSPQFSTANQFGIAINNPSGSFVINGNQELSQGNNYFWLAYNIKPNATIGNTVDGSCNYFILSDNGAQRFPEVIAPNGYRAVGPVFTGIINIPGDTATIAEAVTVLNTGIVGSGGVTYNILAGYTETITTPIILRTSGSAANPIVFQKSGTGNNPLVSRTDAGSVGAGPIGGLGDGVMIIEGADYVTFDAIDIQASNQGIEYGYYLRKAGAANAPKNITIKNSTINLTKGTSRYVVGICAANNGPSSSGLNIVSPAGRIEDVTVTGNSISDVFCGMYFKGSATFPDLDLVVGAEGSGNTINNFGGNAVFETWGIYLENNYNSGVRHNIINNIDGGGSGFTNTAYGIYDGNVSAAGFSAEFNSIQLTSTSSALYGLYSLETGEVLFNANTVSGFTGTGGISGVYLAGNCSLAVIKNNQVFDLSSSSSSSTAGLVNGIQINSGDQVYLYNNVISGLKAPSASNEDALRGISVTSSQENSYVGVYHNTVYLDAASSGSNFGSSGIYHAASPVSTTALLDLRNNVLVNKSVPAGSGSAAAFRRSAPDLANYFSASNFNVFYAGTPGPSHVIYSDGTPKQAIDDYKTHVGPNRDSLSFSEDVVFADVSTEPYDLHLQPGSRSYCESGARTITSPIVISTDIDGNSRMSYPDIGADEFTGIPAYIRPPSGFTAVCEGPSLINLDWSVNPSGQDVIITAQTTPFTGNPVNGVAYNTGDIIASAGTVIYKGAAGLFSHTVLTDWTQYFYKIWSVDDYDYYSEGIYSNAITDADTIELLPYFQDFDEDWDHSPSAPNLWKVVNTEEGTLAWRRQIEYSHSAPACAEGSGNQDDYLVSPPIALPDSDCRLVWWDKVENSSQSNTYRVLLSTTGSNPADFTAGLDTIVCTSTSWTRHQLDISAYNDQTVYLAFHQYFSASDDSDFAIDDIYVDLLPSGPVVEIDPDGIDFGTVNVTAMSGTEVTEITNRGVGVLTITGVSLTGADQDQFILTDANVYPINLGPDESLSLSLQFNPTTVGDKTATLAVSHNISGSPATALLSGEGQLLVTTWLGTVSGDWNNAANWSNGVPGPGSEAIILPGTHDPEISTFVTVYRVTVSDNAFIILTPAGGLNVAGK